MSTDKTHFRTSVSGFNKADVLEYLDKLNADFREESARSSAALEEKNKKIEALTEEAEKLKAELAESKALYDGALTIAAEIREELDKTKSSLAECEAVIASQTELIDKLKKPEEIPAEEGEPDAETERKAELYDGVSSQLGDILIAANKSADEIIAGANERARRISDEATASAQSARDAFSAVMEEYTKLFAEKAAEVSGGCCEDINAELQRTRDAVDRVLLQMQKSSLCIAERTEQAKAALDGQLKSSLDTLDAEISKINKNDG